MAICWSDCRKIQSINKGWGAISNSITEIGIYKGIVLMGMELSVLLSANLIYFNQAKK